MSSTPNLTELPRVLAEFWIWFTGPLAALPMSPIEIAATAFGLASVALTVRENIGCWPTGLVMVALYAVVFWNARLYSDAGLQVIYVFMQIYGWWAWRHGGRQGAALAISRLGRTATVVWLAVAVLGTLAWGRLMAAHTDAALPFWDAYIVAASLVAQWLLGRKILDTWYFWISVDIVAVGTFLAKDLYLTAGLYAVFLGLATAGLLAWRRRPAEAA